MRTLTINLAISLIWLNITLAQQVDLGSDESLSYNNCQEIWPDDWRKHEICTEFPGYAWTDSVSIVTRSLIQNWNTGFFGFNGTLKYVVPPPQALAFNLIIINPVGDTVYNRMTFYPLIGENWSFNIGFLQYVYTDETILIVNPIPGEYTIKSIIRANQFTGHTVTLSFSIDSPVPVELSSFTAKADGNNVQLNWTTATEVNTYGFTIERQAQGKSYTNIAFVPGNGNSNSPKNYIYLDNGLLPGSYMYRLKQVDLDGSYKYYGPLETKVGSPLVFNLEQNYPNPFNPSTTIRYSLPETSQVTLTIYGPLGQLLTMLVNEELPPGTYVLTFNDLTLPSGIYFYHLRAGNYVATKKMSILK